MWKRKWIEGFMKVPSGDLDILKERRVVELLGLIQCQLLHKRGVDMREASKMDQDGFNS